MTIGATDFSDQKASWSNFGKCVDWFAPGVSITSTWHISDTSTATLSGTSMATPMNAGVSALYLESNPDATPAEVREALLSFSTKGIVTQSKSDNNHLLYSYENDTTEDHEAPEVRILSPSNGAFLSRGSTVAIHAAAQDDEAVVRVETYVNGKLVCEGAVAPYICNWTVPAAPGATHSIQVKAFDSAMNVSEVASIEVKTK